MVLYPIIITGGYVTSDMNENELLFNQKKEDIQKFLIHSSKNPRIHPSQMESIHRLLNKKEDLSYLNFHQCIPMMSKSDIFGDQEYLKLIFSNQGSSRLKIVPAAGTTASLLSFRIHDDSKESTQYQVLSHVLQRAMKIEVEKTLVLNAYPTGISLPTSIHSIECSAKPEIVVLALKSVAKHFENVILLSQPKFLKYCVSHGYLKPVDLKSMFFFLGGAWYSKALVNYLSLKSGLPPEHFESRTYSLYGIAEVGLGIGIQTPELAALRNRLPLQFSELREKAWTSHLAAPMVFKLDSNRFFLESIDNELVITALDVNSPIPILRYKTGDLGSLLSSQMNSDNSNVTLPPSALFMVFGRKFKDTVNYPILGEKLEEILDSLSGRFEALTGNFLIKLNEIVLEISDSMTLTSQTKEAIISEIPVKCTIDFATSIAKEKQITTDLIRKPIAYG